MSLTNMRFLLNKVNATVGARFAQKERVSAAKMATICITRVTHVCSAVRRVHSLILIVVIRVSLGSGEVHVTTDVQQGVKEACAK